MSQGISRYSIELVPTEDSVVQFIAFLDIGIMEVVNVHHQDSILVVNILSNDELASQGAKASADTLLTKLYQGYTAEAWALIQYKD